MCRYNAEVQKSDAKEIYHEEISYCLFHVGVGSWWHRALPCPEDKRSVSDN
jgi:hypothetical protein